MSTRSRPGPSIPWRKGADAEAQHLLRRQCLATAVLLLRGGTDASPARTCCSGIRRVTGSRLRKQGGGREAERGAGVQQPPRHEVQGPQ